MSIGILAIALGVFAFLVALVGGMVVLSLILRRTGGYAPGWQIRCSYCDRTRPAAEAGIVRVAASGTKHTLGYCSQCKSMQRLVIERTSSDITPAYKSAKTRVSAPPEF